MSRLLTVLLALLLGACGTMDPPRYFTENPVGSDAWTEVQAPPAWVEAPPARQGFLRFRIYGRSNLRGIAAGPGMPMADRLVEAQVASLLLPVVGEENAAGAAIAAVSGLEMVERSCCDEILTRDPVPGNTLCTVWALWETPLSAALDVLPEDERPEARSALEALEAEPYVEPVPER